MDKKNRTERKDDMKWRSRTQISHLIQMCKENQKMFFILAGFAVIIAGSIVFISFSEKRSRLPVTNEKRTEAEDLVDERSGGEDIPIPEEALEKDAYPEVNNLIKQYYQALADGDMDTIHSIRNYVDEEEELKIVKKSEFIESYPEIVVYTKKGPAENSFIAYVQYNVKFKEYEGTAPGLNTLYICANEEGSYYINSGQLEEDVVEFLKTISVQNDVMDLFNTVQVAYNNVKTENEKLSGFLDKLPGLLTQAVGEAIVEKEAMEAAAQPAEEEAGEEAVEVVKTVKTTDVVNVRSSDSIEADKLGKTTKGQILSLIEERMNGWSKVEFEGKEGYIKTEFLENYETEILGDDAEETEEGKIGTGKIKETVNVRKTASTEGEKLGQLSEGSSVEILEKMNDGWTKIRYNDGEAYVKSDYVE